MPSYSVPHLAGGGEKLIRDFGGGPRMKQDFASGYAGQVGIANYYIIFHT
jgi:hypothetical protein